jgi:hypothetical protein
MNIKDPVVFYGEGRGLDLPQRDFNHEVDMDIEAQGIRLKVKGLNQIQRLCFQVSPCALRPGPLATMDVSLKKISYRKSSFMYSPISLLLCGIFDRPKKQVCTFFTDRTSTLRNRMNKLGIPYGRSYRKRV